MKRISTGLLALATMVTGTGAAHAQVAHVTYYEPTTVYYSAPVVSTPVVSTPVVTSYSAAAPVVVRTEAPTVTYYRAPAVTYYRAATPQYSYYPSTSVVTRYRPLVGRTVSRYVSGYAPVIQY